MKYAETWLDVGRLPLRRRDRAAMALALNICRGRVWGRSPAEAALMLGGPVSHKIAVASSHARWPGESTLEAERRPRARLALLLRVLLRVDAGDYGAADFEPRLFRDERGPTLVAAGWHETWFGWHRRLPVRPLWEIRS